MNGVVQLAYTICFQLQAVLSPVLSAKSFISKSEALWSPVFVQLVFPNTVLSALVRNKFVLHSVIASLVCVLRLK